MAYNWPRRLNTKLALSSNTIPYLVYRTLESIILALLSTILNTSNQNYQAMLMMEPLDTANIVDIPADLSTLLTT
jgi:hypothetical protein